MKSVAALEFLDVFSGKWALDVWTCGCIPDHNTPLDSFPHQSFKNISFKKHCLYIVWRPLLFQRRLRPPRKRDQFLATTSPALAVWILGWSAKHGVDAGAWDKKWAKSSVFCQLGTSESLKKSNNYERMSIIADIFSGCVPAICAYIWREARLWRCDAGNIFCSEATSTWRIYWTVLLYSKILRSWCGHGSISRCPSEHKKPSKKKQSVHPQKRIQLDPGCGVLTHNHVDTYKLKAD